MGAQMYAGVSEEEFAAFVAEYRKLCAVTPFVYVSLFADAIGKGALPGRRGPSIGIVEVRGPAWNRWVRRELLRVGRSRRQTR